MYFNKISGILNAILSFTLILFSGSCNKEDEEGNIIKDINGNAYHYIIIGTQTWLQENLKTTSFNDGTPIPQVTLMTEWDTMSTPAYCWYQNDETAWKNIYGTLYNWHTVNSGKLCPAGWHVPSRDEWNTLINHLGGDSIAGGSLKEKGVNHWAFPNNGATNESGFTALPGGIRFSISQEMNLSGYWWSSTENSTGKPWCFIIEFGGPDVYSRYWSKNYGLSVRCIRD